MSPGTKAVLAVAGLYLAGGVATAAYTAWLWSNGKPHFQGLGDVGAPLGLAQTVALWPVALAFNVTGKG